MWRLCIILIGSLFAACVVGAPVYKSKDEFGRPVFSDEGTDDTEEIEIEEITTYPSQADPTFKSRRQSREAQAPDVNYTKLDIVGPPDATVRDNAGNLELRFEVVPAVGANHQLELMMDGEFHRILPGPAPIVLQNVDRGTHSFQLKVRDRLTRKVIDAGPAMAITLQRYHRPIQKAN